MKKENNIIEFAEKHTHIYNPFKCEYEKIKLFDFQKTILKKFDKERFVLIKQIRQMGIDTMIAIFVAYYATKTDNTNVLLISNNTESAIKLLTFVKNILITLKEKLLVNNQKNILLKNGSRISTTSASLDCVKGTN